MGSSHNISLSDSYGGCRYGSNGEGCGGSSTGDEGSNHGDSVSSDSGSGNKGGSNYSGGSHSGCRNCGHSHFASWDSESFFSFSYSDSLSYSHSYHYKPKMKAPPVKKGGVDKIIVKQKVPKIAKTDMELADVDAEMPIDTKPLSHADVKTSVDRNTPKGSSVIKSNVPPKEKKTTVKTSP